jgi:peptide/nickel transport system substrate-binding protein
LSLLSFSACSDENGPPGNGDTPDNGDTKEIINPDTLVIADIADIDSLDPAYAYDVASAGQIQSIYETLIGFDGGSTTDFVGVLATEWTISEDGRTYRFRIREGVTFHNGNPLTPEDVEYTFERGMVQDYILGPQWMFFEPLFGIGINTSRTNNGLIPLEEIKSKVDVDGQWVQFNLAAPYEPFLQILSSSWGSIVDKDWCIQQGDWNGTQESYEMLNDPLSASSPLNAITNGTGPYMLEFWQPAIEISLIQNPNYWGQSASIERVVTKIVPEWSLRKLMFEQGEADTIVVPQPFIGELEGLEGIKVYEDLPFLLCQALFFQHDIDSTSPFIGSGELDGFGITHEFFSDLDIRKGFAYAFDWESYISDGLLGLGKQIATPIVEGLSYYDSDWQMYSHDLTIAEEYFRAAWDGSVWENGFEFTMVYASGDTAGRIAAEILQGNLFAVNNKFKINIQLMDWPTLLTQMAIGRLPIFINGWTADYPDAHNFIFPFMHSLGTFSAGQRYSNSDVDSLIVQAIASVDSATRQSIYDQLEELYYEDVPSIMIAQLTGPYFFRDWVQGFEFNPMKVQISMYASELSKEYP